MLHLRRNDLEEIVKSMSSGPITAKDLDELIKGLGEVYKEVKEREDVAEQKRLQKEKEEREKVENVTCMELPLDYENYFEYDMNATSVRVESASDALITSLNNLGRVDIEYMSVISGLTHKALIVELKGAIYQNPDKWEECFYKGWETADEYLSGNLLRKRAKAVDCEKKYKGWFQDNIRAIDEVLPDAVSTLDIYVTLGSPWVPTDVIEDFIDYLYNHKKTYVKLRGSVIHDEETGTWEIIDKNRYYHDTLSTSTYGTDRMEALYILEKTLNMRSIAVTDEVPCISNKSGKKRVINQKETLLAIEKQKKMIKMFQNWVWRDDARRERLEIIYENNYSCYRTRKYNGSFLTFPKMNPDIVLYPYQKDAVSRILFSPNTLLAHDVGSGKTYIMIAAGMEMRRMGLSKKNMYVVPNNIVGQWNRMFLELYPSAHLLVVEPKHFTPAKRQDTLKKIRDNDYDAVIMAYSCFDQIPLSYDYYLAEARERKKELENRVFSRARTTHTVQKKLEKMKKEVSELSQQLYNVVMAGEIYFDQLGITRLFVDEAHNYKNVPVETKINNVLGISETGSEKCKLMMAKVHQVQKSNEGKGVVFATGTPITNSITDAFIMQLYLQSGELALLDIQNFDAWVGMFAEKEESFEIDVDTKNYRLATRFSKFHNIPELTSLLSSIADFHITKTSEDLPVFTGYTDALVGKTPDFQDYLDKISDRAEAVRKGQVGRNEDNMLLITTDGRKAALDLRLVDNTKPFVFQSKVARCAENVYNIYDKTMEGKLTQLVFCDTSVPSDRFNMYDELKRLLLALGIPEQEIAFIHDATTDKSRLAFFDKVQKGEIRVLMGSTFKLGIGVNVQNKLVAIHHLDVPWRPADMVQREGRILRPGNTNGRVFIYRYVTEGSFDAYSWQLLESKQRFISGLLAGSITERNNVDISDTILNYAEVKALAIGNPLIKKRVEKANELTKLYALQAKHVENKDKISRKQQEIPTLISQAQERVDKCKADFDYYTEHRMELGKEDKTRYAKLVYNGVLDNEMQIEERVIGVFQGFDIILPSHMQNERPFIYLARESRHQVEIGESEVGVVFRMINCLDNLGKRLDRLRYRVSQLEFERIEIERELNKPGGYLDEIEALKNEIKEIDRKLGVKLK